MPVYYIGRQVKQNFERILFSLLLLYEAHEIWPFLPFGRMA